MDLFGYPCEDYKFPNSMDGWNCVDIGSHAGTTAYQMLIRGAAKVRCFEPGLPQILECRKNLAEFGDRVEINHMAVWRSGEYEPVEYEFAEECSGMSMSGSSSEPTPLKTIGLDGIIVDSMRSGVPIDLVKIDAEISEFPILYTSSLLRHVKMFRLEVHDLIKFGIHPKSVFGGIPTALCTIESMIDFLTSAHFDVSCERNGHDALFLVSAKRKN